MEPQRLFLERCEQVRQLLESHREVDVLDLAARLRQLILDQRCLVAIVNSNRIKLGFEVGYFSEEPDPFESSVVFRSLEDGVDPLTRARAQKPLKLNLDQFLAHQVMIINGRRIRIKEIIQHLANKAGGVHFEPRPKEEVHQILKEAADFFSVGGLPAGVRILKGIGRVALRGLEPLIHDINSR